MRSASPLAGPPPAPLLPFAASPEALPLDQGHLATVHAQPAVPPSPWPTCAAGVSQHVTQTWSPARGARLAREPVASGRSGGGAAPSPLSLRPSCGPRNVRAPSTTSSHLPPHVPSPLKGTQWLILEACFLPARKPGGPGSPSPQCHSSQAWLASPPLPQPLSLHLHCLCPRPGLHPSSLDGDNNLTSQHPNAMATHLSQQTTQERPKYQGGGELKAFLSTIPFVSPEKIH